MDERTKVLICLGSATAANCIPCFEHFLGKAEALGVSHGEIQEAVELAGCVKNGANLATRNPNQMNDRRLLVMHQGALGDFVITFPALVRLRNLFSRIDVLCQGKLGKMASDLGLVDRFYSIESGLFASLYGDRAEPEVMEILRSYHDIVLFSFSVELEQTIEKSTTARVYRIPPREDASRRIHAAEHIFRHLAACGLLRISHGERDSIDDPEEYPDRREPGYDRRKILLHPGSGSRKKNWPISNFVTLEGLILSDRLKPSFILGPAERDMAAMLAERRPDPRDVLILEDLSEMAALLKRSGGFIGNDSGLTHLSAFLGLPTVAIFGPSDPERWRPLGRAATIVSPSKECQPCFETDLDHCTHLECLSSIRPETVKAAFDSVVSIHFP